MDLIAVGSLDILDILAGLLFPLAFPVLAAVENLPLEAQSLLVVVFL